MRRSLFRILRAVVSVLRPPSALRDIVMWPVASRLLPKDHKEIVDRGSYKIAVDLEDQLNRMLLFFGKRVEGVWEPRTMALLKRLASSASTIVTAGSHIGFVNLELFSSMPESGSIHTFEPASSLYARTAENVALNRAEGRISVKRAALADREGEAELFVSNLRTSLIAYTSDHAETAKREKVPVVVLDEWRKGSSIEKIDLLVLDVEGYELRALKGAEAILREDRPLLCLEVAKKITKEEDAGKLFAFLRERGYRVLAIDDDYALQEVRPGRVALPALLPPESYRPKGGYYNVLAVPDGHAASAFITSLCREV